jgi:MtN3 and saliva related transmembrane protein
MMFWDIIGVSAATLTMFGFLPQIVKMWKKKSARDVSGLTLIQFCCGIVLWMFYGIHLSDWIIIGSNAVSLGILLFAIALYLKLGRGARD